MAGFAACDREPLRPACGRGPSASGRVEPHAPGDVFHVTFHDVRCYALDWAMVLSGFPDTIVALSGQLSCEVIGAGAETVSGTSWLTAARNGRLALLHYDQESWIAEQLHLGMRLPTEDAHPMDHPDGDGIIAATTALGFSAPALMRGTHSGWDAIPLGSQSVPARRPGAGADRQALRDA